MATEKGSPPRKVNAGALPSRHHLNRLTMTMTAPRAAHLPSTHPSAPLDAATVGEIIQMALSDHVSFAQIRAAHGLHHDEVKALMRTHLAPGSYRAWSKRVRQFGERRENYK